MLRGLYTSASGMLATQAQSDIVADNIANVRTPGYKEEQASNTSFPTMLLERIGGNTPTETTPIGGIGTGVVINRITRLNQLGPIQTTELDTDLALVSQGFFVVRTPDGDRYTRNGQFQVSQGYLQTADGHLVLGLDNEPIGPLGQDFKVNSDGMILDEDGTVGHQLQIVDLPQESLERAGQSLFSSNQQPQVVANVEIRQGAIESSNVDVSNQMVKMITVMRAYEANQKVIQTQDATLEKAVNEVGRI